MDSDDLRINNVNSKKNIEELKNVKKLIKKVISTKSPDDKYYLAFELSDLYDNISFGKLGISHKSHKCKKSNNKTNIPKHNDYSFAEWLISNDNPLNKTKYALSLQSVFEINNLVIKTASEYVKNQFINVNGESFPFLKLVLYSYKFYKESTYEKNINLRDNEDAYQNYFRGLNISFSCKYRNIDITVYLYTYVIDMQSSNYPIKLKAGIRLRTSIGSIFQKAWWSFL